MFCRCQLNDFKSGIKDSSSGPIIGRFSRVSRCPATFIEVRSSAESSMVYFAETLVSPSSNVQWQSRQRAIPLRGSSLRLMLHGTICAASTTLWPSLVTNIDLVMVFVTFSLLRLMLCLFDQFLAVHV